MVEPYGRWVRIGLVRDCEAAAMIATPIAPLYYRLVMERGGDGWDGNRSIDWEIIGIIEGL